MQAVKLLQWVQLLKTQFLVTKARQMKWDALFFGQVASFHPVIASQPDGVTDGFYTFAQFDTPSKANCHPEIVIGLIPMSRLLAISKYRFSLWLYVHGYNC